MCKSDFAISDNRLERYCGNESSVTVTSGIRVIGTKAFKNFNAKEIYFSTA